MRKEATLEQWKVLYEAATRIKERKPWEQFWDMDLIGVTDGPEGETVFFSILGRGGTCYGIAVYEGFEGLNTFLMLAMRESLNLSPEYAMLNQTNLTCYWGNRDELTDKQRKIIKELGYKYRGKNQWLYFQSYKPGYCPYNLDEEEVLRMSSYLQKLDQALALHEQENINVDFESGNLLLVTYDEGEKTWKQEEAPLPFTSYQFGNLIITDEELLNKLAKAPGSGLTLEADIVPMGASVSDKAYDRPANPMMAVLGEAASGLIIHCEMTEPDDDPMAVLAEEVLSFILQSGAPKEIRVSNVIVEAALEQICEVCKTRLRRVKRLAGLEDFKKNMHHFGF